MARDRLQKIEQADPSKHQMTPKPEDVRNMADLYEAPELVDYYCTQVCPCGLERKPLQYDSLGEVSTSLLAALHFLNHAQDKIHAILRDSKVSESEIVEFRKVLNSLMDVAHGAESL